MTGVFIQPYFFGGRGPPPEGEALAAAGDAYNRAADRAPLPAPDPEPPPDPLSGLPPMARVEALGRVVESRDRRRPALMADPVGRTLAESGRRS